MPTLLGFLPLGFPVILMGIVVVVVLKYQVRPDSTGYTHTIEKEELATKSSPLHGTNLSKSHNVSCCLLFHRCFCSVFQKGPHPSHIKGIQSNTAHPSLFHKHTRAHILLPPSLSSRRFIKEVKKQVTELYLSRIK